MRILMTCDPEIPVPPGKYGGVERLVSGLCQEYQAMGHEVYLVANRRSTEPVKELFGWKSSHSRGIKNVLKNAFQLRQIVNKVNPDIIHSFSRLLYLYPMFLSGIKVPVLQTYGRAISQKSTDMAIKICGKYIHFACCGAHMLNNIKKNGDWNIVYNFVDTYFFHYDVNVTKENYVVFLGRICHQKGTRQAIEAAIKANIKIKIAGLKESPYFEENVMPFLDNPNVEFIGLVDDNQKLPFLQKAMGLLFPINGPEAFGIVLAESFACGTPVIGFNRYSVPEIITPETGFITENVNEMADKISELTKLDPEKISEYAKNNFSRQVIASHYISLFNQWIKQ